jgi:hypothetical protein
MKKIFLIQIAQEFVKNAKEVENSLDYLQEISFIAE